MTGTSYRMIDVSGQNPAGPDIWEPVLVKGSEIAAEAERLADLPAPANGRRAAKIVHHQAKAPGYGFAPGIGVTINVLKPGERTEQIRHLSNQLEICIGGKGVAEIDGETLELGHWDVCTIPSMRTYSHRNTGSDLMVRLSFSNAPVLEMLGMHYCETGPAAQPDTRSNSGPSERQLETYNRATGLDYPILDSGARMRSYEYLTDIEVVPNPPLLWPWQQASQHLSSYPEEGKRSIFILYNPSTERRIGTTHTMFASLCQMPPSNIPPRGHRHSSSSINYHMAGSGSSEVDGVHVEWNAGDLLLSAPGWSEHAHAFGPEGATIMTVQDHPFHIGCESLIWQERLDGPILTLGSETGQAGYVAPRQIGD